MATAMAIGRPTLGALCLSAAVVCAFLAHEPFLVFIGGRGPRARRDDVHRARHWLIALSVLGVALAAAAVAAMPRPARVATLLCAPLGAIVVALAAAGRERTVAGEALTAIALASVASPIAIASGALPVPAVTCAIVLGVGAASAAVAVRSVIAATRTPPGAAMRGAAVALALAAEGGLVWLRDAGVVAPAAHWTAIPLTASSVLLAALAPPARELSRVGWMLIVATFATAAALVATLR